MLVSTKCFVPNVVGLALAAYIGALSTAQAQTPLPLCSQPKYAPTCNSKAFELMQKGVPKNQPASYVLSQVVFHEAVDDPAIRSDLAGELLAQAHRDAAALAPATRVAYLNLLADKYFKLESSRIGVAYAAPQVVFELGAKDVIQVKKDPKVDLGSIPRALQVPLSTTSAAQGGQALGELARGLAISTQEAIDTVSVGALTSAIKSDPAIRTTLNSAAQLVAQAQQEYRKLRSEVPKQLSEAERKARSARLDGLADTARKAALAAADQMLKSTPNLQAELNMMAADAQAEARVALGSALGKALSKWDATTAAERAKLEAALPKSVGNWGKLSVELTKVSVVLDDAADTLKTSTSQVAAVITQVSEAQKVLANPEALKHIAASTLREKVSAAVVANFVEQEVLAALPGPAARDLAILHGAYRGLPQAQNTLTEGFSQLKGASTFNEKLTGANAAIGATLVVAKGLGISISPDVEKGVSTLQTGLQLAAAFSGANPFAAVGIASNLLGGGSLGSLGGLGGGGDSDAAAAGRHAEVMAALASISEKLDTMDRKLDEMLAMQREALTKLDDLSKQLADTRVDILKGIAQLQTGVDYLLDKDRKEELEPFKNCARFWGTREAELDGNAQRYGSHSSRQQAFKDDNPVAYQSCRSILNDPGFNSIQLGEPHRLFQLSLVETAIDKNNQKNLLGKGFYEQQWRPMLALTKSLLSIRESNSTNCLARLMAAAAAGSEAFVPSVQSDHLRCGDVDIPDKPELSLYRSAFSAPKAYGYTETLLDNPTSFPLVKNGGDMLAFIHPFELMLATYGADKPATPLPAPGALLNHTINASIQLSLFRYLDIAYWSMAQESIYAGVPIADAAAKVLVDSNFGTKAPHSGGLLGVAPKKDEDVCEPQAAQISGEAGQYKQVLCMMNSNPVFAANVMARVAQQVTSKYSASVSIHAYRLAYYQPTAPSVFGQIFEGTGAVLEAKIAPLVVGANAYRSWVLKLPRVSLSVTDPAHYLELELPTPFQFETQRIVYGPQMRMVRAFKDTMLQRLLYLDLGPTKAGDDSYAALKRQTVLSNPNPLALTGFRSLKIE